MANVKISALPSYTGSAADLRWFVMNNSGETTTYKYSGYSSPFLSIGTTNKVIQPVEDKALLQIGSGNTFNDYSGSNVKNAVAIGDRNKVDGVANTPLLFIGNDLDSQQFGSYALHIGNSHYASGSYNISVGDNSFEMNGSFGLIIGSGNGGSQQHKQWGSFGFNLGQSCQIQGIDGAFIYGKNHTISGGQWGGIFGGIGNSMSSSGNYNTIIGGENNSITGGTLVAMVGTSGRTATASATTYVENLHTYRTPSTQVQPISSGTTFTCNLDNGAKSQFYLTGASTINITNVRDGASFMIKTQTDGNYNITWTATGYTFVFEGGLKDPGNNVTDIFVFEVFGSVIYGNRRHNYS
jgi:hypothetical protein